MTKTIEKLRKIYNNAKPYYMGPFDYIYYFFCMSFIRQAARRRKNKVTVYGMNDDVKAKLESKGFIVSFAGREPTSTADMYSIEFPV